MGRQARGGQVVELDINPRQDHGIDSNPIGDKYVTYSIRTKRDRLNGTNDIHCPQVMTDEFGSRCFGDDLSWAWWSPEDRTCGSFSQAFPAIISKARTGPKVPFCGTAPKAKTAVPRKVSGTPGLLPMEGVDLADEAFKAKDPRESTPLDLTFPGNWTGILHAGTDQDLQQDIFHPDFLGLVAVNFGGDPRAGTRVWDTDDDGNLNAELSRELQSIFSVIDLEKGTCTSGKAISLNLGKGGRIDGGLGYLHMTDWDDCEHGIAAGRHGGPLTINHDRGCIHQQGSDKWDNKIFPVHIPHTALFKDGGRDAPLEFTRLGWNQEQPPGPFWQHTWLKHQPYAIHQVCGKNYPGKWAWQTPMWIAELPPPIEYGDPPPIPYRDPYEEKIKREDHIPGDTIVGRDITPEEAGFDILDVGVSGRFGGGDIVGRPRDPNPLDFVNPRPPGKPTGSVGAGARAVGAGIAGAAGMIPRNGQEGQYIKSYATLQNNLFAFCTGLRARASGIGEIDPTGSRIAMDNGASTAASLVGGGASSAIRLQSKHYREAPIVCDWQGYGQGGKRWGDFVTTQGSNGNFNVAEGGAIFGPYSMQLRDYMAGDSANARTTATMCIPPVAQIGFGWPSETTGALKAGVTLQSDGSAGLDVEIVDTTGTTTGDGIFVDSDGTINLVGTILHNGSAVGGGTTTDLDIDTAAVTVSGTTAETSAQSYSVAADTLATNGDMLVIRGQFTCSGAGALDDVNFDVGGTTIDLIGGSTSVNGTCEFEVRVIRTAAGTQDIYSSCWGAYSNAVGPVAGTEDETASITLALRIDPTDSTKTVVHDLMAVSHKTIGTPTPPAAATAVGTPSGFTEDGSDGSLTVSADSSVTGDKQYTTVTVNTTYKLHTEPGFVSVYRTTGDMVVNGTVFVNGKGEASI